MKYKHALFLNPYFGNSETSAMMLFPPTGLEYVATSAQGFADKITLIDLRYEKDLFNIDKVVDFITKNVDIVCVGIAWDRRLKEVYELLNRIPATIPLIVGGYTATEKVEEIFEYCPAVDIVVRGEGEETIQEVLKGAPAEAILGISYRKNGTVVHNAFRPLPDLKHSLSPDRSLRRNKYCFTLNGVAAGGLTFDAVLSARGCPYHCKFCTFSLNPLGQKRNYSARDIASVIDEIEKITAELILFSDENFAVDPRRAEAICDQIIARGIKKRFIIQVRIDIAQYPSLLEKMVKAGFKILLLGVESPHDRILAQLDKGFDSATIRKSFAVLKKYPLFYHGYFIYGNIGETEKEMLYISQFAKEICLDSITFQKLRIEKFSPLREIAEKTPGYHVTAKGELYSDTYSHIALKRIGRRIKFSFYTPWRFLKILKKCFRIKLFTFGETMAIFVSLPLVVNNAIVRDIQKGRFADSLRRMFVSNR